MVREGSECIKVKIVGKIRVKIVGTDLVLGQIQPREERDVAEGQASKGQLRSIIDQVNRIRIRIRIRI